VIYSRSLRGALNTAQGQFSIERFCIYLLSKELPMNRWFTTADENAAPGGMTGLVGAFSLET